MAASSEESKTSDNDRNDCISPVSQYETASEGETQEGNNVLSHLTPSTIDENTPITSLTAGKLMEIFTHSLQTNEALVMLG